MPVHNLTPYWGPAAGQGGGGGSGGPIFKGTRPVDPKRHPGWPQTGNLFYGKGYADGGYVDSDPMNFVPDPPLQQVQQPRDPYDPYDMTRRKEQVVSPYMLAADQPTGYAYGGEVEDELSPPAFGEAEDLERRKFALQRKIIAQKQAELGAIDPARQAEIQRRKAEDEDQAYLLKGGGQSLADATATRIRTEQGAGYPSRDAPRPLKPSEYIGQQGETRTGRNTAVYPERSAAPALSRIDDEDPSIPENARPTSGVSTGYRDTGAPAAAPTTGYGGTAPSSFDKVIDYIHGMFSIGGAQAAEGTLPQRKPPAEPDPYAPPARTGYSAGGYGGDLEQPPPIRGGSPDEVTAKPMPAPLSLQSPAPPSISGQDTPRVAQLPGDSRLARLEAEQEARRKAEGPVSERSTFDLVTSLPRAAMESRERKSAEKELYEGPQPSGYEQLARATPVLGGAMAAGRLASGAWQGIRSGLEGLIGGDHPKTPAEALKVLDTMSKKPLDPSHGPMVQQTFDELGRTGGVDAQANFTQALRPPYDRAGGVLHAALSQGRIDMALKAFEVQQNLLPNNIKTNAMIDPEGGGIVITTRPEGAAGGQANSYRLSAKEFYDLTTGPGTQFDHVGKNGLDGTLKKIAQEYAPKGPAPGLLPGDRVLESSAPGGGVRAGPGGAPAQIGGVGADRTSSAMGGAATLGRSYDPATGNIVRRDPSETTGTRTPRYDVERNIGDSERPTVTDPRAGVGVQGIIANTRRAAEQAAQNRGPQGEILDPTAPARSLTATDPRSIAARDQFAQRVARQPAAGPRSLTADERVVARSTPAVAPAQGRTVQAASPTKVQEPSERLSAADQQAAPTDQQATLTATGSATEGRSPATPEQEAAVLRTYRGDRPPWPAPQGRRWLRSPSTGMWQLG